MNWELITSPEFEQAVDECGGVCILPLGVLEKHGDHLPLGQDAIYSHRIATLAAEQEPAMVFPQFYLSQILEAKMVPGTITLGEDLIIPLRGLPHHLQDGHSARFVLWSRGQTPNLARDVCLELGLL